MRIECWPPMLEVVEVRDSRALRRFTDVARQVHCAGADRWVPPLWLHFRQMMGSLRDPERRFLMALQEGRPVARLGVKVHRHGAYEALHFGFFEALEGHPEAVARLVEEGHRLAPQLPMRGPLHFRLEDPYTGLLVDGFDEDPIFLMPNNPPYYLPYLEGAGLTKLKDLLAYEYLPDTVPMRRLERVANRARRKGIEVRTLDRRNLSHEVRSLAAIFDDALSQNWGFEPFEEEQIQELELLARFILEPEHVWLARRDGVDIGALIAFPNYNPMIKASGGHVTPGFVWSYLRRRRLVDSWRGYAIGVRRAQRVDEVAATLVHALLTEGSRIRWQRFEVGWVLQDNVPMNAMARAMGGRRCKTYRLLERASTA